MNEIRKVPVPDLNILSFLLFKGFKFEIVLRGNYATGLCDATDEFYRLCDEYDSDCLVPVKTYVSGLRQIRAQVSGLRMQAGVK